DGVTPGTDRTSLRLPDALAPERSYYWRSKAEGGANDSAFSPTAIFNVFTPIVIDVPQLIAAANNAKVSTLHPTFTFSNAPNSGPGGQINYLVEVATTDSFATKIAAWIVPEQAGQTSAQLPQDGQNGQYLFWHVRAFDPTTSGAWSRTLA